MASIFELLANCHHVISTKPPATAEQRSAIRAFRKAVNRVERMYKYMPPNFNTSEIETRTAILGAMIEAVSPYLTAPSIRVYTAKIEAQTAVLSAMIKPHQPH